MLQSRLVKGVGINDSPTPVSTGTKDKRDWVCPFCTAWVGILSRCYCAAKHKEKPNYKDCTVAPEWLLFSTFRKWMSSQDWEGKQLDKDLIVEGNKHYSPATCVFLSARVNMALQATSNRERKSGLPQGVYRSTSVAESYYAKSSFGGKDSYLGSYSSIALAEQAYRDRVRLNLLRLSEECGGVVGELLRKRAEAQ